MNRGPSAWALVVIGIVAAAAIWLLATGGSEGSSADPTGDVRVTQGPRPPDDVDLADITNSSVTLGDGRAVFEATMSAPAPESFETESLRWQWELEEGGNVTWLVSANVDIEPSASLLATQFDYSATTVNESLPGRVELDGSVVRVVIETTDVENFPDSFTWSLTTSLDGDRGKAASAVGEDRVPDEGSLDAAS